MIDQERLVFLYLISGGFAYAQWETTRNLLNTLGKVSVSNKGETLRKWDDDTAVELVTSVQPTPVAGAGISSGLVRRARRSL